MHIHPKRAIRWPWPALTSPARFRMVFVVAYALSAAGCSSEMSRARLTGFEAGRGARDAFVPGEQGRAADYALALDGVGAAEGALASDALAQRDTPIEPDSRRKRDQGTGPDQASPADAGPADSAGAADAPPGPSPSFYGDWESKTVIGDGNRNWSYAELVAADRMRLITDSRGTYARVEVRSGDNPLDFCCYDTDRAEVTGMQTVNNQPIFDNLGSGTQRYTLSVKFDGSWQTIYDDGNGAWGIFAQLHPPSASNPTWALSATDAIRLNVRGGDEQTSQIDVYKLSRADLALGKWIDFIVTIRYKRDNSGWITVQRRDEGESAFVEVLKVVDRPTLSYDSKVNGGAVGDHYMKFGFYRNRMPFTSVLYLDNFTRTTIAP